MREFQSVLKKEAAHRTSVRKKAKTKDEMKTTSQPPKPTKHICCWGGYTCKGNTNLRCVPVVQDSVPKKRGYIERHAMKRLQRAEILARCGIALAHSRLQKTFFLCERHFEDGEDWSGRYYYTFNDAETSKVLKCRMPTAAGPKSALSQSPSTRPSRGLAADRSQIRYLELVKNPTSMELQNMAWENDATAPPLLSVNEAVRCLTGIDSHRNSKVHKEKEAFVAAAAAALAAASADCVDEAQHNNKKNRKQQRRVRPRLGANPKHNKRKRGDGNEANKKPVADLDMRDRDVEERTGFYSMSALLSFVAVICNGDLGKMRLKGSFLTWLEEWVFYLEWVWGREHATWRAASVHYDASVSVLEGVFATKLKMVTDCICLWPRFVSVDEDVALMSDEWKERYKGQRVIMWDNTNINLKGQPSDANNQRAMYSAYYGGSVAKGGVFLQLCGWLGTWSLWAGAISDTDYMHSSGILEAQREFVEACKAHPNQPFTITSDKGYRC
jgi:hypothetical protein